MLKTQQNIDTLLQLSSHLQTNIQQLGAKSSNTKKANKSYNFWRPSFWFFIKNAKKCFPSEAPETHWNENKTKHVQKKKIEKRRHENAKQRFTFMGAPFELENEFPCG